MWRVKWNYWGYEKWKKKKQYNTHANVLIWIYYVVNALYCIERERSSSHEKYNIANLRCGTEIIHYACCAKHFFNCTHSKPLQNITFYVVVVFSFICIYSDIGQHFSPSIKCIDFNSNYSMNFKSFQNKYFQNQTY